MDENKMSAKFKNECREKYRHLFSLKSETEGNKIIELYVIVIMFIYPLYLLDDSFFGLQGHLLLYILITLAVFLLLLFLAIKKIYRYRKYKCWIDIIMLGGALLLAIQTARKIVHSGTFGEGLLFLCFVTAYFLVSGADTFYSCYLYRLMFPGMILFAGLFYYYFYIPELFFIELMTQEPQYISSFLLMMGVLGILSYCTEQVAWKRVFFFLFTAAGFLLLLIGSDPIVLLLIPAVLLLMPVVFRPTACIVMRSAQLALTYVIFCNITTLIANYTEWMKVEINYNTAYCIYLDIVAAFAAFIFFRYWEKMPERILLEQIMLIKLRKACIFLLKFMGILFVGILMVVAKTAYLPDSPDMVMLKAISLQIQQYSASNNGTFYQVLTEYGLIGFFFIVLIYCLIIGRLIKNFDITNQTTVILTVISVVFLVQSLFIKQQSITTPIYMIFLTYALFSHKMKQI